MIATFLDSFPEQKEIVDLVNANIRRIDNKDTVVNVALDTFPNVHIVAVYAMVKVAGEAKWYTVNLFVEDTAQEAYRMMDEIDELGPKQWLLSNLSDYMVGLPELDFMEKQAESSNQKY